NHLQAARRGIGNSVIPIEGGRPRLRHDRAIQSGDVAGLGAKAKNVEFHRDSPFSLRQVTPLFGGANVAICRVGGYVNRPSDARGEMRMPCYRPKTRHRVRTFGRTAAGLLMVGFLLGGCLTQVYQRGYVLPEGALQQVPLGASQEQVLIVLGTPSTVATLNGDVFYYISQRTEKAAAFIPDKPVDQRVIAIYFDKDRRVQRIADTDCATASFSITSAAPRRRAARNSATSISSSRTFSASPAAPSPSASDHKKARLAGGLFYYMRRSSVRQHRQQQQRHDVGDLDHRVDRGTRRVLVGVADGVAGHCGFMRIGTLAPIVTVLNVFLGIVPGAAARSHRDRDEQSGDDDAEQHGADRGEA